MSNLSNYSHSKKLYFIPICKKYLIIISKNIQFYVSYYTSLFKFQNRGVSSPFSSFLIGDSIAFTSCWGGLVLLWLGLMSAWVSEVSVVVVVVTILGALLTMVMSHRLWVVEVCLIPMTPPVMSTVVSPPLPTSIHPSSSLSNTSTTSTSTVSVTGPTWGVLGARRGLYLFN